MIRFSLIGKLILPNRIQNGCNSCVNQIFTQSFPLQFKATPALCAEPLKKKKKIDPGLLRAREERKKRKIEKEIRKLQKLEKQLKPVAEFEVPNSLIEEKERRTRNVTVPVEEAEERILVLKEWSRFKLHSFNNDMKELHRLINAQKRALDELRLESEELYQAAVKIDENLIPLKFKGPAETPPKDDYPFPDGVYKDVSRKWS